MKRTRLFLAGVALSVMLFTPIAAHTTAKTEALVCVGTAMCQWPL